MYSVLITSRIDVSFRNPQPLMGWGPEAWLPIWKRKLEKTRKKQKNTKQRTTQQSNFDTYTHFSSTFNRILHRLFFGKKILSTRGTPSPAAWYPDAAAPLNSSYATGFRQRSFALLRCHRVQYSVWQRLCIFGLYGAVQMPLLLFLFCLTTVFYQTRSCGSKFHTLPETMSDTSVVRYYDKVYWC